MTKKIPLILSMALICCSFTACGDGDTVSSHADEGNSVAENTDGFNDENKNSTDDKNKTTDSQNAVEEIITDAGNAVDDLVSRGEEIVTDVADGVEDMVDGTSTSATN